MPLTAADRQAWHGGTPNLSQYTRAIPHPGLFSLPPENPTRNHSLPCEYNGRLGLMLPRALTVDRCCGR